MLGQYLHSDGRFGVPLEYFHKGHWAEWEERTGKGNDGSSPTHKAILTSIGEHRTSDSGICSIKAHWNQFFEMIPTDIFEDLTGAHYVFIRRRDVLAQAISWEIAHQTGSWIYQMPTKSQPKYQRSAINARMLAIARQQDCWRDFFSKTRVHHLEVVYEDFVLDLEGAAQNIGDFVGIDPKSGANVVSATTTVRQSGELNEVWRDLYLSQCSEF